MPVDEVDERTHETLAEELDDYDRESVEAEVERALAEAPDPTSASEGEATFELFEDDDGKWRWRLLDESGAVITTSDRGYPDPEAAQESIGEFKEIATSAEIAVV